MTFLLTLKQLLMNFVVVIHGGLRWRSFYLTELIYNFYYLIIFNLSLIISVKKLWVMNALSNRDMYEHLRFIDIVVKIKL